MQCPKCLNEMEKVVFEHVEIDRCDECRGIWFDDLEHEELKVLKGAEIVDDGDVRVGKEFNKIDRIVCPKCKTRMIRMVDRVQPHIWYESCSVCNGLFFDAGEFNDYRELTIIDRFRDLLVKERR